MKVLQIGFNKCGTTSLNQFFLRNGYKAIHWDHGKLALQLEDNHRQGRPLLSGYEEYQFFSDMELISDRCLYAFRDYYQELDRQYPGSRFILNTRSVDKWINSRLKHNAGTYLQRFEKIYGCGGDEVVRRWKYEWYRHHANVLQYFHGRENFLLFNIEQHDGETLKRFLQLPKIKAEFYRHDHRTAS